MALTTFYTADAGFARGLGRAHERDVPGTNDAPGRRDSGGDLYNNDVGIGVGSAAIGVWLGGADALSFIVNSLIRMTSTSCRRRCLDITGVRG